MLYTCHSGLQKLHILGREKMVHAKKEKEEEINVRHDERKKFLCKPQVVIVCIV
jgi:hypothetical protein